MFKKIVSFYNSCTQFKVHVCGLPEGQLEQGCCTAKWSAITEQKLKHVVEDPWGNTLAKQKLNCATTPVPRNVSSQLPLQERAARREDIARPLISCLNASRFFFLPGPLVTFDAAMPVLKHPLINSKPSLVISD